MPGGRAVTISSCPAHAGCNPTAADCWIMQKAVVLSASLLLAASLCSADGPMTVTSDTKDYCINLASRLDATSDMPPHARALWERGRSMCEAGHIRGGLFRLRRAMQIIHGMVE